MYKSRHTKSIAGADMEVYEFAGFLLDKDDRKLRRTSGEVLNLTPRIYDLLVVFVESGGIVLKKEELLEKVWSDTLVEESNLSQSVFVLRKALNQAPHSSQFIRTIPGVGYRFCAPVTLISRGAEEQSDQKRATLSASGKLSAIPRKTKLRKLRYITLSVLGAGALIVSLLAVMGSQPLADGARPTKSVTVLPFVNDTDDPELEYLANGLGEGVTNELAHLSELDVTANSVALQYRGITDPSVVAKELGSDAVLVGKVFRDDISTKIRLELIDPIRGKLLWGETYGDLKKDLVEIPRRTIARVVEAMGITLAAEDRRALSKRYTDNPDAYSLYLRGSHFVNIYTRSNVEAAIGYFKQALMLDPSFAPSHAGLSRAYSMMHGSDYEPGYKVIPLARNSALRSIELDPYLAEGYLALAMVQMDYDWDWKGAEASLKRAIELMPENDWAHALYSFLLIATGRYEESLFEIKRACEINPIYWQNSLAVTLLYQKRFNEARTEFDKALEVNPNSVNTHFWRNRFFGKTGDEAEALKSFRTAVTLAESAHATNVPTGISFSKIDFSKGLRSAHRDYARIALRSAPNHYVSSHDIASSYVQAGENEEAIRWLERAYAERSSMMYRVATDPVWDPLRSDARFQEILRRMNLDMVKLPSV